jgi:hypothetical protein
VGEGVAHRLKEGQLCVSFWDVSNGNEGIGAVEQGDAQYARVGAHDRQGLLGPENREKVSLVGAVDGRARLDVAFGIGEQRCASIMDCAFREAVGEGGLPIRAGVEGFGFELQGGDLGRQRELPLRGVQRRVLAVTDLIVEAQAGRDREAD